MFISKIYVQFVFKKSTMHDALLSFISNTAFIFFLHFIIYPAKVQEIFFIFKQIHSDFTTSAGFSTLAL